MKMNLARLGTAVVLLTASVAVHAQTIKTTPVVTSIWVGAGASTNNFFQSGSLVVSNAVALNSIAGQVDFTIAGMPTGLFATLNPTNLASPAGTVTVNVPLTIQTTNLAAGIYPLTFTAADDGTPRATTNFTVFAVPQWNINTTPGLWSDGTKWTTGISPASTDNVLIEGNIGTSNTVDTSRTIQSLMMINTGDAANSLTMEVLTNVTLTITGTNGLILANKNSNSIRNVAAFTGAGTVIVSNRSANVAVTSASGTTRGSTLTMSNLNTFVADINRLGVADITLLQQGLYGAQLGSLHLARTNIIRTAYSDNYDAAVFNTAIQMTHEADAFSASGSSTISTFLSLGISNAIFADSISVGRARSAGSGSGSVVPPYAFGPAIRFNATLTNTSATALFRGTNGGRMSLIGAGIDSGTPSAPNNAKGVIALNGGTVDMQVDRIWLGRNRSNATANSCIGGFLVDAGVVDANYVYAGYQFFTNSQNCAGYICISNTAVFKVNNVLTLGYSAGGGGDATTVGQLLITNNGVARIRQIAVGATSGGTFTTGVSGNNVSIGNGGNLDITNTIASPAHGLGTLTVNNGTLTIHLDGSGASGIYATNLVLASATLSVSSLGNLPTLPADIVVASYQTASGAFNLGSYPSGYILSLTNLDANTLAVHVVQGVPRTIKWTGAANNQWDTTSTNWVIVGSNTPTVFASGDFTVFDDTPGVPTSITVVGNLTIGQSLVTPGIAMTNSVNNFVFSGGNILGSARLIKEGTGSVEFQNHTELTAIINRGTLTGTGDLGGITVNANGALNFNGYVNGSVTTASTNTLLNSSATVVGGLTLQTGSSVTNLGTVGGALSVVANTYLYNGGSFTNLGSPTFPSNSIVINNGNLTGGNITVSGRFQDNGVGVIALGSTSVTNTLTINGGATFIIGGDGIGTTTLGNFTHKTRVLLNNNSTNVFKVSPGVGNTVLNAFYTDYGPNNSLTNGGGIVYVTNVGAAYAAGQEFTLFTGVLGSIAAAGNNTFPQISPLAPAPGLAWDLSQLHDYGIVRVVAVNTNLPAGLNLTRQIVPGYDTNSALVNFTNINNLTWPADHIGWRLQFQQTTLTQGLTTNWNNLFGSSWTNQYNISQILSTNIINNGTNSGLPAATFFRLIYP